MAIPWVVFSNNGIELLRYSLHGEMEGEREQTVALLAYEYGVDEQDIDCTVVVR